MKFRHPIVNSSSKLAALTTEGKLCYAIFIARSLRFDLDLPSYLPTDFWPEVWVRNCLKH